MRPMLGGVKCPKPKYMETLNAIANQSAYKSWLRLIR